VYVPTSLEAGRENKTNELLRYRMKNQTHYFTLVQGVQRRTRKEKSTLDVRTLSHAYDSISNLS
jgi:hypothetical protein